MTLKKAIEILTLNSVTSVTSRDKDYLQALGLAIAVLKYILAISEGGTK